MQAQGKGKRGMPYSRGQATSFGFKRPVSAIPVVNNNQIASSPEDIGDSLDLLVISQSTARCGKISCKIIVTVIIFAL